MPNVTSAPYKIRMWYPATSTYAAATYSIELRAPEVGNTERRGRAQAMTKTRVGNVFVYDRGIDLDEKLTYQFKNVPDEERSALVVFLTAVSWGLAKLKMADMNGTERTIRIASKELNYVDTGWTTHRDPQTNKILWDFTLEILDLSNNTEALAAAELPVAGPLFLHLSDYDHPHNPTTSITVNIADGAKVVESLEVRDWKAITWIVCFEKNAARGYALVNATNNAYATTDATTLDTTQQPLGDLSAASSKVTLSVDLSGTGSTQVMRLKAATTEDGYTVRVRRIKI